MKSILCALALTGMMGLGAAGAQAQTRIYVGIGAPVVAAVPPCPGAGYYWTPGYYAGPVWVPGRWMYRGYDRDDYYRARPDWDYGYSYRDHDRDDWDRDRDRHYDHDRYDRYDRDRYRYDRDDHGRDHDHR